MAKTEKPFLLKLFLSLLYSILTIVLILGGIWVFFKVKYDINLISTITQINILQQEIKEEEKFDALQTEADKQNAMEVVNACIDGLIIKEDEEYKFKDSNFNITSLMKWNLELTDKNVGAILNIYLSLSSSGTAVEGSVEELSPKLIQVKFLSFDEETKNVKMNFVVKVETTKLKEKMNTFPMSMAVNKIPNNIYISSTCNVVKKDGKFNYEVTAEDLTINNLDSNPTKEFVKVLNMVMQVGTREELNLKLSKMFVNGMIGKSAEYNDGEKISGFANSLENLGADDFNFKIKDGVIYYVIIKKGI